MDRNGEQRLLTRLGERAVPVIFDVGANIGYWALNASSLNPAGRIHSFEIFPETHASLVANTVAARMANRMVANGFDLGAIDGAIEVESVRFSVVTRFENARATVCPVMRGDRYMAESEVKRIDFLKIDVEGGEYDVLMGFSSALARSAVDLIQFEYGPASLDNRKLLNDYYDLLSGYGYEIGRLHGGGVWFNAYSILEDENCINAHFVPCRKECAALRAAITLG